MRYQRLARQNPILLIGGMFAWSLLMLIVDRLLEINVLVVVIL